MPSIFADKNLLQKEYKRLFLDNFTNLNKIKECLSGRYNKKAISDEALKKLFTNNHKVIYDFVGLSNELRITYFFGDLEEHDSRDSQIRLIDRLVLDSIHFEVMTALFTRLNNEYASDQIEINRTWQTEIDEHAHLGQIESIFIMQNILKLNKKMFYEDLIFPMKSPVALFSLNKTVVIPNKDIFKQWTPKTDSLSNSQYTRSLLFLLLIAALLVTPFILGTAFGLLSAAIGAGICFLIVSLVTLIAISFVTSDNPSQNILGCTSNINIDNNLSRSSSALMLNKMPSDKEIGSPCLLAPKVKPNAASKSNLRDLVSPNKELDITSVTCLASP